MDRDKIRELLREVKENRVDVDEALAQLRDLPYEDLGFAKLDHHRALRKGFPEVVLCENKSPAQVVEIIATLAARGPVLATRASEVVYQAVRASLPEAQYNPIAKTIVVGVSKNHVNSQAGCVLVVSAGTSDIPVAEEAAVTVEAVGQPLERLYDVGVAGIHRLFANKSQLDCASVLVVVAGMDGALPSVVTGLVDKPVIAVPTSVGYGASFKGIAPLLTMLNACAPGVVVVNIDNGFGAGYFAAMINAPRLKSTAR